MCMSLRLWACMHPKRLSTRSGILQALVSGQAGDLQTFAVTSEADKEMDHPVIQIMASPGVLAMTEETEAVTQAVSIKQVYKRCSPHYPHAHAQGYAGAAYPASGVPKQCLN